MAPPSPSKPSKAMPGSPASSRPGLTLVTGQPSSSKSAALSASSAKSKKQDPKGNSKAGSEHSTESRNLTRGGQHTSAEKGSSKQQPLSGTIHTPISVVTKNSPAAETPPESPNQFLASDKDVSGWIGRLKPMLGNVEIDMEIVKQLTKLTQDLQGAKFDKIGQNILTDFRNSMNTLTNKIKARLGSVPPPGTNKQEYDTQLLQICIDLTNTILKDPKKIGLDRTRQMIEYANWCIQLSTIEFEKITIDKGIKKLEIALSELQLNDKNRPYVYKIISNAHRIRYSRTGILDDVKRAANCLSEATDFVAKYPDKEDNLPQLYMLYGRALGLQFAHTGEIKEMKEAVSWLKKALGHTNSKGLMATLLTELGSIYQAGYNRLGMLEHINQAIKYHEQAIAQEQSDVILRQLAESYAGRFRRLAEPDDIDKAIKFATQAYKLKGSPDPRSSSILGLSWAAKASQYVNGSSQRLDALDKALQYLKQASTTDDFTDRVFLNECLFNYGNVYHQRFRSAAAPNILDLDQAINLLQAALRNTRRNHDTQIARFAAAVGHSQRDRFLHLQALGKDSTVNDLLSAARHYFTALKSTPMDHPEKPTRLIGLGITYRLQYERSLKGKGAHNQEALVLAEKNFREALTCRVGYTLKREQVNASFQLAKLRQYTSVEMDMNLWKLAMQYVRDFVWMGLSFEAQYVNLQKVADITRDAVTAAIVDGQFSLAMLWMAVNQAIILNMALTKHDALDLPSHSPLLSKLRHLAGDLLDSDGEISQGDLSELDRQKRHRIVEDFEKCIKEALAKDNNVFGDLMISPTEADLIKICQNLDSRVIIINMGKERCDVLSIYQKNITHVPLGNIYKDIMSAAAIQRSQLRRFNIRKFKIKPPEKENGSSNDETFIDLLQVLWKLVTQPVLKALGYDTARKLMLNDREHITWCTRGPLSFMPIDWAGPYDKKSPNLRDLAVSSHIPFISAMQKRVTKEPLKSNQPKQPSSTEIIAFSQENTPGQDPLPGAKAELDLLRSIFKGQKYVKLVEGDIGHKHSLESVIEAIGRCEHVHFACHAVQEAKPLESGIYLTPGKLTVDRIMRLKWGSGSVEKHSAFLSACQTAKGDEVLQDEQLHMAATFYVAGFENVIGTRWSIADEDGPAIAGKYYAKLLKNGRLLYQQSAHALHAATWEHFNDLVQVKGVPMDYALVRISAFIHVGSRAKVVQTMSH